MKTLFFNGCSFIAGDELVWEQYCEEMGKPGLKWDEFVGNIPEELFDFWYNYRYDYRMKRNLPAIVASKLRSPHVDISQDGNSNDMIAFATINYFLNIEPNQRKNYHACIGWTTTARFMKYTTLAKCYFNLHPGHSRSVDTNPIVKELEDYLNVNILKSYEEDVFLNFTKNILMLENFFIANGMTYTFFKSLGTPHDSAPREYINVSAPFVKDIVKDKITNHDNWLRFEGDENLPYMGESWTSALLKQHLPFYVSKTNGHPSILAAHIFGDLIKEKIISQDVGFT